MADALPPPDSNSLERSTVATPSLIVSPSSRVPAGIAELIAPLSVSVGPSRSAAMAAVATAFVAGTSRRTGTSPELPGTLSK